MYVKYKLYSDFEHLSATREQDKNLYWDDINVLLAGQSSSSLQPSIFMVHTGQEKFRGKYAFKIRKKSEKNNVFPRSGKKLGI